MYRVDVMHFASQEIRSAQVLHHAPADAWQTFAFYAYLLRSHDCTLLVDCGMDELERFNRLVRATAGERATVRMTPHGGVLEQLAAFGVAPADVDAIAITHFHADHVWNLELFPTARFVIASSAWEALMRLRRDRPEMVVDPLYPAHLLDALAGRLAERLALVDGEESDVLPGLTIRHIGGHAVDCTAYVAPTSAGRVVFPTDTVWTYANLEQKVPPGEMVDERACREAIDWVRSAGEVVIPPHDPQVMTRHPHGVVAT